MKTIRDTTLHGMEELLALINSIFPVCLHSTASAWSWIWFGKAHGIMITIVIKDRRVLIDWSCLFSNLTFA